MARSTFYYHLSKSKLSNKYADLSSKIKDIFNNHGGRYGYRRITLDLRAKGIIVNQKTVEKLMHQCNIKSIVRLKKTNKYSSYKGPEGKTAPNIIQQNFAAKYPN